MGSAALLGQELQVLITDHQLEESTQSLPISPLGNDSGKVFGSGSHAKILLNWPTGTGRHLARENVVYALRLKAQESYPSPNMYYVGGSLTLHLRNFQCRLGSKKVLHGQMQDWAAASPTVTTSRAAPPLCAATPVAGLLDSSRWQQSQTYVPTICSAHQSSAALELCKRGAGILE